MNSGLLNIWREVGAYLRYGDAKCIFLSGISFAFLVSFVQFKSIDEGIKWDILSRLKYLRIDSLDWVAIMAFGIALTVCIFAIIPTLSNWSVRINFINDIGSHFVSARYVEEKGVIYFWDISLFENAEHYRSAIKQAMNITEELNSAEAELSEQIWIIARIATSKFISASIAMTAILIGLICSFL